MRIFFPRGGRRQRGAVQSEVGDAVFIAVQSAVIEKKAEHTIGIEIHQEIADGVRAVGYFRHERIHSRRAVIAIVIIDPRHCGRAEPINTRLTAVGKIFENLVVQKLREGGYVLRPRRLIAIAVEIVQLRAVYRERGELELRHDIVRFRLRLRILQRGDDALVIRDDAGSRDRGADI